MQTQGEGEGNRHKIGGAVGAECSNEAAVVMLVHLEYSWSRERTPR